MTIDCDVLVVGGGPAGLITSIFLTDKGLSVVLIEKKNEVGSIFPKFDITEGNRIKPILDKIDISPNKISSQSDWVFKKETFSLESEIQDYFFKRGNTIDSIEKKLLVKLKNNKDLITIFFDSEIDSIKTQGSRIEKVILKDTIILPEKVIFADGGNLHNDQHFDPDSEILASFEGLGSIMQSSNLNSIPHAKIYFDSTLAPGGYIYTGSVNKEMFACVVIDGIFSKKIDLNKNLDEFLETNFGEVKIINQFYGKGISGIRKTVQGNTYKVGGSAYFHDSFLGYGLNYAIESAYYAAQAIINGNDNLYKSYCKKIQNEIKDSFFAREIWRKADDNFFNSLINQLNGKISSKDKQLNQLITFFT